MSSGQNPRQRLRAARAEAAHRVAVPGADLQLPLCLVSIQYSSLRYFVARGLLRSKGDAPAYGMLHRLSIYCIAAL